MSATEESLSLLRSIDASLKALVKALAGKPVAEDRDLDSKHGDPAVGKMPRDWTGENFEGRHMSECPPDLLDMIAERFDYFADRAEEKREVTNSGKPVAPYKRMDAARARGWAKRKRAGWKPANGTATLPTTAGWADDDRDVGF